MGTVLITLLKAAIVVGLIVAAAWYLVPVLLRHIVRSRSRELFLLSIIVLCLGIAWLTSLGGALPGPRCVYRRAGHFGI